MESEFRLSCAKNHSCMYTTRGYKYCHNCLIEVLKTQKPEFSSVVESIIMKYMEGEHIIIQDGVEYDLFYWIAAQFISKIGMDD